MSSQSKVIKVLKSSNISLKESLGEACDHISGLHEDLDRAYKEMQYLNGFIESKGLLEEFCFFRTHAHPDTDSDMPFPPYIL